MIKTYAILLILASYNSYAQIKATIYTKNRVGVEFNITGNLSTEVRIKTDAFENSFDLESEFLILYRVLNKQKYDLRLGMGLNYIDGTNGRRPFKSFIFPVNFEIKPFKSSFISFIFEPSIIYLPRGINNKLVDKPAIVDVSSLVGVRFNL